MSGKDRAVVLLSGGVDSATTLAVALEKGFEVHALSFDYGQRNAVELESAEALAHSLGAAEHRIVRLNLRELARSPLTGSGEVPKGRREDEIGTDVPPTYVPARNTIFLSIALAWAESLGAGDIFIGANAVDYAGYPDCGAGYLEAFEAVANLGTRRAVEGGRIRVQAPLLEMTKADIIRLGSRLGVDFSLTHSCYDPAEDGAPCGQCDSCLLRKKGFAEAGIEDPREGAAPDRRG